MKLKARNDNYGKDILKMIVKLAKVIKFNAKSNGSKKIENGRVRPKMEYDDRGNTKMVYTEYLETEDQKKKPFRKYKK